MHSSRSPSLLSSLALLAGLFGSAGCSDPGDGTDQPDAAVVIPTIPYAMVPPTTWALAMTDGAYQLSVTDATGPTACGLAADHQNGLATGGHQLLVHIGDDTGTACPQGAFSVRSGCPRELGSLAHVPEGCAYYREWDAQGALLGMAVAINGEITINGTASSCTIRANVGFVGGSFAHMVTLTGGEAAQPWCN